MLFCQSYFDRADAAEARDPRARRFALPPRRLDVDAQCARRAVTHGRGRPEEGFMPYDWRGYNEAMILLRAGARLADARRSSRRRGTTGRSTTTGARSTASSTSSFAPLFGHQYSHVWIDFRGIQDAYMRAHGHRLLRELAARDARAARLRDREPAAACAATARPMWGLTRLRRTARRHGHGRRRQRDVPHLRRARRLVHDESRRRHGRARRAAGGSIPFAPEIAIPTLIAMREQLRRPSVRRATDSSTRSTPRFRRRGLTPQAGHVVPGVGWFDSDYLGIDQGPILAMIENHRSGLVWRVMRTNPYIKAGLKRAGFTGGWLDQ